MKRALALLAAPVVVLLLALPLACTATIVPPAQLRDAVSVFVLVQEKTSSLVLPAADDQLVRYAYGDWRYYALRENTAWNGIRALLWPTQGTLGRGELPGAATAEHINERVENDALHEVRVQRDAAARLLTRLDAAHAARRETEVDNVPYGLRFVHQEPRYTYFYNSNHAVADWLQELGCEVRGPTYGARWRVEERP